MIQHTNFDVIIIGGSYSGLSAALALGRSLRKVLVIDHGKPCNANTPHSHNFITHDGEPPRQIALDAKAGVARYDTVQFYEGQAVAGLKTAHGFEITTGQGDVLKAAKLIFATGLKDLMPDIKGFAECWGKSVIHCPYCHGYEVKGRPTGVIGNGEMGFHYGRLISHWAPDLTIFTNGVAEFSTEQREQLNNHHIKIIETGIGSLQHTNGQVTNVVLKDGMMVPVQAVYSRPEFIQHSDIPKSLGCEFTEQGLIKVDALQRTSVDGVYACGDNSGMRSVAVAVASGTMAGTALNNDMIAEEF